ncbi:MAG: hypothetical protein PF481_01130 [Bacteroidales bacterium]|jgi:hypothetical protein|nr:hypothetical protein [Bacteroidales bacterium]
MRIHLSHLLLFLYIILHTIFCTSCSKNPITDHTISETFIEFPQSSLTHTISYTETAPYTISIPFQIMGKELSSQDSAYISLTSTNSSEEDLIYDSIIKSTPNTFSDTIYIEINKPLYSSVKYNMTISLHSFNSQLKVSDNYKTCTIDIIKESFSDFFSGTYSCYETSTQASYTVEFTAKNELELVNHNFWDFPLDGQTVSYIFSLDTEHSISIPESEFVDKMGNIYTVEGTGNYWLNGNFSVNYTMKEENGDIYEQGTHEFTKQ